MAPVAVREIISCSSEDPRFPASNILGNKKWLTDAKDNSGNVSILLQLAEPSRIHYIDIGYLNVSSLEIQVGRSSWPSSHEYSTILPSVTLQTSLEARAGKNKTGCRMLNCPEHLDVAICQQKWDRVKIKMSQQFFKNKQMGLEFIRISSPRNTAKEKIASDPKVSTSESSETWKHSSIGKLAQNTSPKSQELQQLQSKLLRISATTEDGSSNENTLSRTAKMVLSSRSSQNTPKTVDPKIDPPTLERRKSLLPFSKQKCSSPKNQNFLGNEKTTDKQNFSKKISGNGERKSHDHVSVSKNNDLKLSRHDMQKRKSLDLNHCDKNNGTTKSPNFLENLKNKENAKVSDVPSASTANKSVNCTSLSANQNSEIRKPHCSVAMTTQNTKISASPDTDLAPNISNLKEHSERKESIGSKDAENRSSTTSSGEEDLPKSEVKRIKNCIQQFFNGLDIEEMNPDNVTLKELRTGFEAMYDITLDKNGRSYFRNATANYLKLVMAVRKHKKEAMKGTGQPVEEGVSRKRTTDICASRVFDSANSPAKVRNIQQNSRKSEIEEDCQIVGASASEGVQCPICMAYFPSTIINDHAALCGDEDVQQTSDLQSRDNDLEIVSVTESPSQTRRHPRETFIDLSDNMRLSEAEKTHWLNFSRKPKSYHPRMDRSLYKGCELVKCPTCGQFYKSQEVEEHSEECAEKVHSGLVKRGLYYVKEGSSQRR